MGLRVIGRRVFLLGLAGSLTRPATAAFAGGDVLVSAEDIDWFRRARAEWFDCEGGAPGLRPDGLSYGQAYTADKPVVASRLMKVQCAFFLHAAFAPGAYRFRLPIEGRDAFTVSRQHVKLLQHASWRLSFIDCKRPYGLSSYYEVDMARLLDQPLKTDADGHDDIAPDLAARMQHLHREMVFVLAAYVEHADLALIHPVRRLGLSRRRALRAGDGRGDRSLQARHHIDRHGPCEWQPGIGRDRGAFKANELLFVVDPPSRTPR